MNYIINSSEVSFDFFDDLLDGVSVVGFIAFVVEHTFWNRLFIIECCIERVNLFEYIVIRGHNIC